MKNNTTSSNTVKQKTYNVSKKPQKASSSFGHYTNMSYKSQKSSIKSKKQSAAAIQNYFDNSKMLLNNSANYHVKSSSKKPKKKGYTAASNNKNSSNSGWEMLANLSSSSRERKYFKELADEKNLDQRFNTSNPFVISSLNNHSFNLSNSIIGSSNVTKKSGKFKKSVKQSALHSYTNMNKKKHPRASSNNDQQHINLSRQDEYIIKSSKKKNNILFKLASELSQSPDTVKVRKAYGKENHKNDPIKTVTAFGIPGNCSGHRMNTEATDDASLNSSRNRNKSKNNEIPTITLDDSKTPDSKAGRTISYNNEFDQYNKSRNEDAITCKRD